MSSVAALDERTQSHARELSRQADVQANHEGRIKVLEVNWARLVGFSAGAAALGGIGGGGIVAVIARVVGG